MSVCNVSVCNIAGIPDRIQRAPRVPGRMRVLEPAACACVCVCVCCFCRLCGIVFAASVGVVLGVLSVYGMTLD